MQCSTVRRTKSPPNTLSNIVYNAAHLRCLKTATQVDAVTLATDTRVPFREMSRFISISQPHSGDWCDLRTDGSHSTTPLSGQTRDRKSTRLNSSHT